MSLDLVRKCLTLICSVGKTQNEMSKFVVVGTLREVQSETSRLSKKITVVVKSFTP